MRGDKKNRDLFFFKKRGRAKFLPTSYAYKKKQKRQKEEDKEEDKEEEREEREKTKKQ